MNESPQYNQTQSQKSQKNLKPLCEIKRLANSHKCFIIINLIMISSLNTSSYRNNTNTELLPNLDNKKNKLKIRVGIPTNLEHEKHPDEVPRIIHRIWIGGQVRESDLANMLDHIPKTPNGDYPQQWLWVDGSSTTKIPIHYLRHIRVIQIADLFPYASNIIGSPSVINQLHSTYLREANGGLHNYAAASDIARYMIMYIFGGMYLDMDVTWLPNKEDKPLSYADKMRKNRDVMHCNPFSYVDKELKKQSLYKAIMAMPYCNGIICAKPLAAHFLTDVMQKIITAYEVTAEWNKNKRELQPIEFDSWVEKRLYDDMGDISSLKRKTQNVPDWFENNWKSKRLMATMSATGPHIFSGDNHKNILPLFYRLFFDTVPADTKSYTKYTKAFIHDDAGPTKSYISSKDRKL